MSENMFELSFKTTNFSLMLASKKMFAFRSDLSESIVGMPYLAIVKV